jgi:hypothetical protein
VGGIVAGILGLILLVCGGCLGFGFFVLDGVHSETARQLSVDYRNDAKVKEEVGDIQEIKYNWSASIARDDGSDVYDVRGDKGTAQFVVDPDSESVLLQNGRGEWELGLGDEMIAEE